ncbi:MAG: hypothetical protein K0S41_2956 [Anaerocolumna sp.]|jgi:predicted 3-demethylubiquinone-9 3-methyltransferase (glyoxalase superfamily)|nr:hypothetical protein [Anaerocolumna sp.]
MNNKIQKITPNLWFDKNAEEAVNFYTSIFKNSKIHRTIKYGKERHEIDGLTEDSIMTIEFELDGQVFVALNGGPYFKFSEAISFIVNCDTQEELDYYWDKLCEGGDESARVCGWLKDKFGVSWQIVPTMLNEWISDKDSEKSARVMRAVLDSKGKLDIQTLKEAYERS